MEQCPVRYILRGKVVALFMDGNHTPPPKFDTVQVLKKGPFDTWVDTK